MYLFSRRAIAEAVRELCPSLLPICRLLYGVPSTLLVPITPPAPRPNDEDGNQEPIEASPAMGGGAAPAHSLSGRACGGGRRLLNGGISTEEAWVAAFIDRAAVVS